MGDAVSQKLRVGDGIPGRQLFLKREHLPKHKAIGHFRTSAARDAIAQLQSKETLPLFQQRLKHAMEFKMAQQHTDDEQPATGKRSIGRKSREDAKTASILKAPMDSGAGQGIATGQQDVLEAERKAAEAREIDELQKLCYALARENNQLAATVNAREKELQRVTMQYRELKTAEHKQLEFVHTQGLGSEDVLAKEEELEYTHDAIAEAEHTSKVLEKMNHRAERTRNEMRKHLGGKQKEAADYDHDISLLREQQTEPFIRRDFELAELGRLQKTLEKRRTEYEKALQKRSQTLHDLNEETKLKGQEVERLDAQFQKMREQRTMVVETISKHEVNPNKVMMAKGREILLRKAFRLVWGDVQLQKIKPKEIVERFFNHQVVSQVWEETVAECELRVKDLKDAKQKAQQELAEMRMNGGEGQAHYKSLSIEHEEYNARLSQAYNNEEKKAKKFSSLTRLVACLHSGIQSMAKTLNGFDVQVTVPADAMPHTQLAPKLDEIASALDHVLGVNNEYLISIGSSASAVEYTSEAAPGVAATEVVVSEAEAEEGEEEPTETVTLVGKRRKQHIGQHNVRIQQDDGSPRSPAASSAADEDDDEGAFGDLDARQEIKKNAERLVHIKTQRKPVKPKKQLEKEERARLAFEQQQRLFTPVGQPKFPYTQKPQLGAQWTAKFVPKATKKRAPSPLVPRPASALNRAAITAPARRPLAENPMPTRPKSAMPPSPEPADKIRRPQTAMA